MEEMEKQKEGSVKGDEMHESKADNPLYDFAANEMSINCDCLKMTCSSSLRDNSGSLRPADFCGFHIELSTQYYRYVISLCDVCIKSHSYLSLNFVRSPHMHNSMRLLACLFSGNEAFLLKCLR